MAWLYCCCLVVYFGLIGALNVNDECTDGTKTCYNCDLVASNCVSSLVSGSGTEEQCLNYLASSSISSVVYDSLTMTCTMYACKTNPHTYKKGSVAHIKGCDKECRVSTLMFYHGYEVSATVGYSLHSGLNLQSCLPVCFETNSSCTVMHDATSATCRLYTYCKDVCEISHVNDPDVSVVKRLCEPEGTFNVAFNKTTSMSSLWTDWGEPYIYRSPLGADGITTQNKYADTCFVTDGEVGPWWRVDLGATYRIYHVYIYNRRDCCSERAHDLVLSVGLTESDLTVKDYLHQLFSTYPFTLPSNTVARYVQIEINATYAEFFHLCEVEVFGLADCGSPMVPENGSVFTAGTAINETAEYSCNTGYVLSGDGIRTCRLDRTWSGNDPSCDPVNCGPLTDPLNGSVTASGLTYLHAAAYDCDYGYVMSGSAKRVCMSNGIWNGTIPECDIVDCGPLSSPQNGSVHVSGTTFQSVATYSCETAFTLSTSSLRICLANGSWDGMSPVCKPVQCGNLTNPQNGTVYMPAERTYLSQAMYNCSEGFAMVGNTLSTCQLDGNWSHSPPECIHQNMSTTTTRTLSTLMTLPITSASTQKRIYIMPCLCYHNKTFVNMTMEEIIAVLVTDTKIEPKNTTLSMSKLKCRADRRTSSKLIGAVGATVLTTVLGLLLCADLHTLLLKVKRL